jgi:hypothetical protein
MKKYFIGLALSGAAARINRFTRSIIPSSKKPTTAERVGTLLVGAGIGATAAWALAQKKRIDKEEDS